MEGSINFEYKLIYIFYLSWIDYSISYGLSPIAENISFYVIYYCIGGPDYYYFYGVNILLFSSMTVYGILNPPENAVSFWDWLDNMLGYLITYYCIFKSITGIGFIIFFIKYNIYNIYNRLIFISIISYYWIFNSMVSIIINGMNYYPLLQLYSKSPPQTKDLNNPYLEYVSKP